MALDVIAERGAFESYSNDNELLLTHVKLMAELETRDEPLTERRHVIRVFSHKGGWRDIGIYPGLLEALPIFNQLADLIAHNEAKLLQLKQIYGMD